MNNRDTAPNEGLMDARASRNLLAATAAKEAAQAELYQARTAIVGALTFVITVAMYVLLVAVLLGAVLTVVEVVR